MGPGSYLLKSKMMEELCVTMDRHTANLIFEFNHFNFGVAGGDMAQNKVRCKIQTKNYHSDMAGSAGLMTVFLSIGA